MRSDSIRLFERMERVKGENALSEAFAICLQTSTKFQKGFLRKVGAAICEIKIETRKSDSESKKVPDLTITGDGVELFLEIKEKARLYPKQWNGYRKIADDRKLDPNKCVFAIVAPWANIDAEIKPRNNIIRWTDVFAIAVEATRAESDEVCKFLLREFMDFLEERAMKPFDGFSEPDIDTINRIPEAGKKLRDFLQEVYNSLSRSPSPNSPVIIKSSKVEVKTYKDYPEVYAWVSFIVQSKRGRSKAANVWFGIQEYQAKGPSLALGVWTNGMWASKAAKNERSKWQKKLKGLGFIWDETGEDGFVRPLKMELKSSEKDPNLLENMVRTIREEMSKVYDRL